MAAVSRSIRDGDESGRGISIADLLGACHAIACAMRADGFAIFSVGAARERARLTPLIDSEHPAVSSASTILSSSFGDEFVKRAVTSTLPSWWSGERESASIRTFQALADAGSTALGLPDMPGIAFPVYAEGGTAGLIAFTGTEITMSDPLMHELHARCFALFEDALRLGLDQTTRLPAVSQRERDCLRLTANGYTSEEIAVVLALSVHTTNQYLTRVTMKLNAVNRMHAVAKALRLGLIE